MLCLQDMGASATPAAKKRSRWDETPAPGAAAAAFGTTPSAIGGAFGATPAFTPGGAAGLETPAVPGMVGAPGGMTPDQWHADKAAREMYERNRPLSDEELDAMLPGAEQVSRAAGVGARLGLSGSGSSSCIGSIGSGLWC